MSDRNSAVILSACRTAIGSFGGTLKSMSAVDLGAIVIRESVRRAKVDVSTVDDVVMGCVLQAGAGMNVARQASLKAGVPQEVPAETINRVCGSGLQAVVHAAEAIGAGMASCVVAGGTESMSGAPYLLRKARWGHRMGHGEVSDSILTEGLTCAIDAWHMGITAEEVADRYGVDRSTQDAFAAESQRRAVAAIDAGLFKDEIVPVSVPRRKVDPIIFASDEYPRADTTEATLATLRPAFKESGTVTAGNASGINDGAAALVVASAEHAQAAGITPLAEVVSWAIAGVEPRVMGIGPVPAVRKALERAGMQLSQIDLFELNEAFAAQSVAVVRELGVDAARVNPRGGAIALGHPIGASGARVLTTLIYALKSGGGGTGVASLCIGGGMGIAMVIKVTA